MIQKKNKPKTFELDFDEVSKRFVLNITDFENLFPLVITGDKLERRYVLIHTQTKRLQLR